MLCFPVLFPTGEFGITHELNNPTMSTSNNIDCSIKTRVSKKYPMSSTSSGRRKCESFRQVCLTCWSLPEGNMSVHSLLAACSVSSMINHLNLNNLETWLILNQMNRVRLTTQQMLVQSETNITVGQRTKSERKCHVTDHTISRSDKMAGQIVEVCCCSGHWSAHSFLALAWAPVAIQYLKRSRHSRNGHVRNFNRQDVDVAGVRHGQTGPGPPMALLICRVFELQRVEK